ncbi:MAG: starch-binding protein [Muribaculaceae bacterium]|nr:starch-binding protein [Muribaculaceae bacterium]
MNRLFTLLTAIALSVLPAAALTVYFDNSEAHWTQPRVHHWDGLNPSSWPGDAMTLTAYPNIWSADFDDSNKGCLFTASESGPQTSDLIPVANHVYTLTGDTGKTLDEYLDLGEPGETIRYTISFHNNVGWDNIHVDISGTDVNLTGKLDSFLNSVIFDYSFDAPENLYMTCRFYNLDGSVKRDITDTFRVVNGHVYTISGDKGPKATYDPSASLPEAEYWLEPANPSQKDKATLYFNRAYNPAGPLHNSSNIEIFTGLIEQGGADSDWHGGTGLWSNHDAKYRMTQSATDPDLFYIEFSPSIVSWYGCDATASYDRIAVIFRDGSTKQHEDDQFLSLSYIAPATSSLGAVTSWSGNDDNSITFTCEEGCLTLTPWAKDIVKVFTLPAGATVTAERPSISVVNEDTKAKYNMEEAWFNVTENDDHFLLAIPDGVTVRVDKATALLAFINAGTPYSSPTLIESGGLSNHPGGITVTFAGMDDTAFYGGGYNGNHINWDGKTMTMNNTQGGNWGIGASTTRNICIPFYVSTSGYGVYFDDHYRNATVRPSRFGSLYRSSSENPIAYYYIGGGTMERVLENYTALTGKQELPPYWALGYITSKFSFATRAEAEQTVTKTKACNVPLDGIVFDIHWQTGSFKDTGTARMGRIDWETSAYPDPVGMMQQFRDQHVHTIAITEPYFTSNSYNYDFLKSSGYLADNDVSNMSWLQSDKVGLLDITNPSAVEWYKDLYKKRTAEGIESWWLDLGEPESHDADSHYQGGNVNQVHNEYGNRWLELTYDAMKEQIPDTRFITMPRAGTAGMQRYNSFPWTGDIARSWGGLQAQVPALVSAAMSGVSYLGSDIGGFTAYGTDADLYRRWVQLGVFYPSMRTHSSVSPEVWQPAYSGVLDDVRKAINLRYAYLPYTYTQSYNYTVNGTPIARPANFNDSDKSILNNEIGAYLWGPDVYVAPVLDDGTTKNITFPEGDWLDMNDFKKVYAGHTTTGYNAPTSVLPCFMRRGAFVPRYRQSAFTSTEEINSSELIVDHFAPLSAQTSTGMLYEDDHTDVNSVRDEKYILTRFSSTNINNTTLLINVEREGNGWTGMPSTQDIHIRIHDFVINNNGESLNEKMVTLQPVAAPAILNEDRIQYAPTGDAVTADAKSSEQEVLASTGPAFYHDIDNNKLYMRIPGADTRQQYTLTLGDQNVETGINNVESQSSTLTLEYADNLITYSAAKGLSDVTLHITSATGINALSVNNLAADGYTHQSSITLPAGIYVARLTAVTSTGATKSVTLKLIVKN